MRVVLPACIVVLLCLWATSGEELPPIDPAQTPGWTADDVQFYLHGSLCDEVVPERVLRAFAACYPDLFPGGDLSAYGVLGAGLEEPPVGFSRRKVDHLGGQVCWGINCAACHTGRLDEPQGKPKQLVLSMPGTFDAGGFFGAVAVSMLRTAEPKGMSRFLRAYLVACDPKAGDQGLKDLDAALSMQHDAISKAVRDDPFASKEVPADQLHPIDPATLELDSARVAKGADLVPLVKALLALFHDIRACLHVPEHLPKDAGTPAGKGRADATAGLANGLFGIPRPANDPAKMGVPWDLDKRTWLDWDGGNRDATSFNVTAALLSGCPMTEGGAGVDFKNVMRFRSLSEKIRPPKYPFAIDAEAGKRGERTYTAQCASCHEAAQEKRLFAPSEVGTDPNRAKAFDAEFVDGMNKWLAALKVEGFEFHPGGLVPTGKYVAPLMDGVWARAPYLHNGSVRTMWELLTPPAQRAKEWYRDSRVYDQKEMGFTNEGMSGFDTSLPGNSAAGHDCGTSLPEVEKRDLIEYLKTR